MKYYIYQQSNGELSLSDGEIIGWCYAGIGVGKNNPSLENQHACGPLPRGWYTIGKPYDSPTHGPITFDLTPDKENEMFGRDEFKIHPDSIKHPGLASLGCIVTPHPTREYIANQIKTQNRLQVIE